MSKVSIQTDGAAEERRRSHRAGLTVRVEYATVDELFTEFTRDINEGGLFIATEKPQEMGAEVSMLFTLPGSDEPVRTIGRVVRISNGEGGETAGMGIEFDELTSDDRSKINSIIRDLRSAPPAVTDS